MKTVQVYMNYVQMNAERAVREMLKSVGRKISSKSNENSVTVEEKDYMDDESVIHLKLSINSNKGETIFYFSGTSAEVVIGTQDDMENKKTIKIPHCFLYQ